MGKLSSCKETKERTFVNSYFVLNSLRRIRSRFMAFDSSSSSQLLLHLYDYSCC